MAAKFELKTAKNGDFHFNLLATNGQVILQSEMYKAKASAINGIESIKKNAGNEANFERLTSSNGKPYFTLKAANHQIIGQSQLYESETSRDNGIASVIKNGPVAEIVDLTS
ncbi:hypothetical protein MTYP_01533 [Methylophilaceae bacterium]|nr:hypothetical protein MTYP_01533 [Methylophilaceae bacterium]